MGMKIRNDIKRIIEVYHNKYLSKNLHSSREKEHLAIINKIYSIENIQNNDFVH